MVNQNSKAVDFSGLEDAKSLEELETQFEPCGGYLRRKDCAVERPSVLYDAPKLLALIRTLKEAGAL